MIFLCRAAASILLVGLLTGVQSLAVEDHGSPGCRRKQNLFGVTKQFSLKSPGGGGARTYNLHLPSSYDARSANPLMIAYYGRGNNPSDFESETRFSDDQINPDMIVAYPEGIDGNQTPTHLNKWHAWQGPTYARPGVSDKLFTNDLIDSIKRNFCVDETRIYATGHSNGAGFVNTLACSPDHSKHFAAFAPISGAFYTDVHDNDNCTLSRSPLPMLEVHGVVDPVIPYFGTEDGNGGPLPSIPDWMKRGIHVFNYDCHNALKVMRHIRIDGHDHSWPGPESEIDISSVVIEFLTSKFKT